MIFLSILNSFYIYLFRIPKVPPCHSSMLLFSSRQLRWNWIKSAMFNSTRILTIVWIVFFCKNGLYGLTNSKMLQKERCFDIVSWQNMKIMENTEIWEKIVVDWGGFCLVRQIYLENGKSYMTSEGGIFLVFQWGCGKICEIGQNRPRNVQKSDILAIFGLWGPFRRP